MDAQHGSKRRSAGSLSSESVGTLRAVLEHTSERDARAAPVERMIELAGSIPDGAELSIDYTVHQDLGHPLVVLKVPAEPAETASSRSETDTLAVILTPREREIAALVAAGQTNQEIADRLFVTLGTVKDHVHRILRKTGLPNRVALGVAWTNAERRDGM